MIGETKQTFFTVKDLPADEFIKVFGQHLKKNNLIERPAWVDRVKLSTSTFTILFQETSSPQLMKTGSTTKSPHSPEKSTPDQELESDSSPTSTEASTEEKSDLKDINKPVPRSSDGDFNNWRSKKSSRKTRRETLLKSTPESSLTKEEAPLTELLPNTSNPNKPDLYKI